MKSSFVWIVYFMKFRKLRIGLLTSVFLLAWIVADSQHVENGIASYYHDSLNGNKTASGEIFYQKGFTAAHKTLPFDTWVLVEDLQGQQVVVRINDRLPSRSRRMIDLTREAAKRIELLQPGLEQVTLKIISFQEAWVWFQKSVFWRPDLIYLF